MPPWASRILLSSWFIISPYRVLESRRTFLNLVVEPLIECLHFFFGIRREQVIDSHVGRGYQNRLGVREGIVAVLPVVVPESRSSHSSVRHGLNEQKDIGL